MQLNFVILVEYEEHDDVNGSSSPQSQKLSFKIHSFVVVNEYETKNIDKQIVRSIVRFIFLNNNNINNKYY